MMMTKLAGGIALAAIFGCAGVAHAGTSPISVRGEVRVGYETPTVSQGSVYKLGNSASIGAEGGVDVAVSRSTRLGAFVNYDYANAQTCSGGICLGSDGNIAYGGRIAFALSPKVDIYAKAGGDSFRLKATEYGYSGSQTLSGPMGALGLTVATSTHTYVGVELDYADLGRFAGVNFQRRHAALSGGVRF